MRRGSVWQDCVSVWIDIAVGIVTGPVRSPRRSGIAPRGGVPPSPSVLLLATGTATRTCSRTLAGVPTSRTPTSAVLTCTALSITALSCTALSSTPLSRAGPTGGTPTAARPTRTGSTSATSTAAATRAMTARGMTAGDLPTSTRLGGSCASGT